MRPIFALIFFSTLAVLEAAAMQTPPLPTTQVPIGAPAAVIGPPALPPPAASTRAAASELTPEQQAMLAGVYFPTSMAFDSTGNFYITEAYSSRVRKVTPTGTIAIVAGTGIPGFGGDGGPAALAQLRNPFDIVVDSTGNLYIADAGNSRIRKVTTNGVISTVAGNGDPGFSGDGGPAVLAQLSNPRGIALDTSGNIYIADTGNGRIRKVSSKGEITTIAGIAGNPLPGNPSGDGGPATEARIRSPYGLVVDAADNLYFSEMGASRVRKVAANGTISTVAGTGSRGFSGDGGLATAALLNSPLGVALDSAGNLYISDAVVSRVRQVTPEGTISTIAGTGTRGSRGDNGPADSAQLDSPLRVAFGPSNSLYIVDPGAQRIRAVSQGQIGAVPGTGRYGTIASLPQNALLGPPVDTPGIERVGGPVSAPTCKTAEPNYSDEARLVGYQGSATLDAIISTDGSVRIVGVPHPLGFGLDKNAILTTGAWKCTPSMRGGMPVNVSLSIQINFHLY
jgi:sugar lactone lactonase YvrE